MALSHIIGITYINTSRTSLRFTLSFLESHHSQSISEDFHNWQSSGLGEGSKQHCDTLFSIWGPVNPRFIAHVAGTRSHLNQHPLSLSVSIIIGLPPMDSGLIEDKSSHGISRLPHKIEATPYRGWRWQLPPGSVRHVRQDGAQVAAVANMVHLDAS